jgi:hypothetical protein
MTLLLLLLILAAIPAVVGYALSREGFDEATASWWLGSLSRVFHAGIAPGDPLIYRKPKVSPRPGPRARNIQPAENGDDYYYEVDKFWIAADVLDDGRLLAVTRKGKQVQLSPEDERLRKARLIERLRYRRRFPAVKAQGLGFCPQIP